MLTVRSLFSGIGAFEMALKRRHVPYKLINYCEIDKYASKAYSLLHGVPESLNLGDISKVDFTQLGYADLITYGFPCQDISVAGLQKGIIKGETRSGCLHYAMEDIRTNRPKFAIFENVKNLVGNKFKKDFEALIQELDAMGYITYWDILNGTDYGVPQNRERVFGVSIRKDIDRGYAFESARPLDRLLKDILEDDVEEKYYISNDKAARLLEQFKADKAGCNAYITPDRLVKRQNGRRFKNDGEPMFTLTSQDRHGVLLSHGVLRCKDDIANCIDANYHKGLDNHGQRTGILVVGRLEGSEFGKDQNRRVYSPEGIAPTLQTMTGGNRQPKVIQPSCIRKLTPKECLRLMDFSDNDYEVLKQAGISDSQIYKMAGNSIIVAVAEVVIGGLKEYF